MGLSVSLVADVIDDGVTVAVVYCGRCLKVKIGERMIITTRGPTRCKIGEWTINLGGLGGVADIERKR